MNDLTTVNGTGRLLKVGGEELRVYPLTVSDFGLLQDWVDRQFPDPIALVDAAIERGSYTVSQQQFLYKAAIEQASRGRRLIGANPDADEMVRSMEGTVELLWIAVRKGNPAFTAEDAARVRKKMTFGEIARLFETTNADMVLSDPKAGPGTTPAGTTTTSSAATDPSPSTGGSSSTG